MPDSNATPAVISPENVIRLTLEELLKVDPADAGDGYLDQYFESLEDTPGVIDIGLRHEGATGSMRKRSKFLSAFERSIGGEKTTPTSSGSDVRWVNRIEVNFSPVSSAGFTLAKDAGERVDLGFLSGFVRIGGLPFETSVIAGDYVIDAGCGLVLARALGGGGSLSLLRNLAGESPPATPYRSRNEYSFLRGVSVSVGPLSTVPLGICSFMSIRSLAGAVDGEFASLSRSGLFRSDAEISRKGAITEKLSGGRLLFACDPAIRVGLTLVHTRYAPRLRGLPPSVLPLDSQTIVGLDGKLSFSGGSACAEVARSGNGSLAAAVCFLLRSGRSTIVADLRAYEPEFINNRFGGPGSGDGANEVGFGVNCSFEVMHWFNLRVSRRQEWTPWAGGRVFAREARCESILGSHLVLSHAAELSLEYRRRESEPDETVIDERGRSSVRRIDTRKNVLALSMKNAPGMNIEITSAFSFLWMDRSASGVGGRGDFMQEKIVWKPARWCSMAASMLLFSSSSYEARTYVLEEDPISGRRWMMLYGEGMRVGLAFTAGIPATSLKVIFSWFREERSRRSEVPTGEDSLGLRALWEW